MARKSTGYLIIDSEQIAMSQITNSASARIQIAPNKSRAEPSRAGEKDRDGAGRATIFQIRLLSGTFPVNEFNDSAQHQHQQQQQEIEIIQIESIKVQ